MRNRGISAEVVQDVLSNPQRVTVDNYGNFIAQQIKDNNLIRVIYRKEDGEIIVITTYRTSKIQKYTEE